MWCSSLSECGVLHSLLSGLLTGAGGGDPGADSVAADGAPAAGPLCELCHAVSPHGHPGTASAAGPCKQATGGAASAPCPSPSGVPVDLRLRVLPLRCVARQPVAAAAISQSSILIWRGHIFKRAMRRDHSLTPHCSTLQGGLHGEVVDSIRPFLTQLRSTPNGKRILSKVCPPVCSCRKSQTFTLSSFTPEADMK